MKKYFNKSSKILLLVAGFSLLSCTKDFEKINTNPNTSEQAYPKQFLMPALVNSVSYSQLRNRNFNNELMQVTVDMSDADGKVFRYEFRNTWSDYLWNGYYAELADFKEMYKAASTSFNYNESYMAISLICQSWLFSNLTDIYGDIPFSEALGAKEQNNFEPKFDAQKDVYAGIFDMLEQANELLAKGTAIEGAFDPVYNGNITNWRRFGNSLYLRLLMRVSGKAEFADLVQAKMSEIVDTKASSYPIMTGDTKDDAILRWTNVAPLTNPYVGIRVQDFRAVELCEFFIDNLVMWDDPRISYGVYGDGASATNKYRIAAAGGQYVGVPSGYRPGEAPSGSYSYFYSSDQRPESLQNEPKTGMIMNYGELQFILAEAALKGYIKGDAYTYYKKGAEYSIKLWVPDFPKSPDERTNIDDYLVKAELSWTPDDTFGDKMNKLHLQKYYSLFLAGMEQWFEYRRTGYPILPKGEGLLNNGEMPARMVYPVYVQSTNPTNYKLAIQAQGPDQISTKVWWQKP